MIADLARAGPGDHPDLLRAARAARHVRPHRRAARGPHDGRDSARRGDPGARALRDDRRRRRGADADGSSVARTAEPRRRPTPDGCAVSPRAASSACSRRWRRWSCRWSLVNPRMLSGANLTRAGDGRRPARRSSPPAQMLVCSPATSTCRWPRSSASPPMSRPTCCAAIPSSASPAASLAACGVGLACGLLNGLVVTVGRVPAIVVTLGTLTALSRLQQPLGRRQAGQRRPGAAGLARHDRRQHRRRPGVVLIALATLFVIAFVLRRLAGRPRALRHRLEPGRRRS